jgi:hypothetical protein
MKSRRKNGKQITIDDSLHAPFKSYCSGIEQRSVKSVISDMVKQKLQKADFHIQSKDRDIKKANPNV